MSIEKQIQTLLREHGSLTLVPHTSTIKDRIASGEYMYVTAPLPRLRDQNGNYVSVAEDQGDEKVVGVIGFRKLNWYLGEVRHFVADPQYTASGSLRGALMAMAESKATDAGVRMLVLTDSSENGDGDHFEALGFDSEVADFDNAASGRNVRVLLKTLD